MNVSLNETLAIFGASGTAGDGLLKAALFDPDIEEIHVITRRSTPRIQAGVDSGRVIMTTHMDYLDYSALVDILDDVDAVFWAREKARAERELTDFASGTNLKIISYRPPYIAPTREQSGFGAEFLHTVFSPIKQAIRATAIGEAMLEANAREDQFRNGSLLENRAIQQLSDTYRARLNKTGSG